MATMNAAADAQNMRREEGDVLHILSLTGHSLSIMKVHLIVVEEALPLRLP